MQVPLISMESGISIDDRPIKCGGLPYVFQGLRIDLPGNPIHPPYTTSKYHSWDVIPLMDINGILMGFIPHILTTSTP